MAIFFVFDDFGTLNSVNTLDFNSNREAAFNLIDTLIDWTEEEGANHYPPSQCTAHVNELTDLKGKVHRQSVDVDDDGAVWFDTSLGFRFCTKHPH
ncbi:hypothetical protein L1D14_04355 [Vibrio tubiashii]|uniref:hypothetical protein n=1 Tax=Vibrio tubiashii TaxID=29498 RepID=UPI001EFEA23F|nr:hypothetical protein [Vibrio tubiashii]MCG9575464.1 hypothetical protein [Vibrio tubiashii]